MPVHLPASGYTCFTTIVHTTYLSMPQRTLQPGLEGASKVDKWREGARSLCPDKRYGFVFLIV